MQAALHKQLLSALLVARLVDGGAVVFGKCGCGPTHVSFPHTMNSGCVSSWNQTAAQARTMHQAL